MRICGTDPFLKVMVTKSLIGILIATACVTAAVAQSFRNLSFEGATYPLTPSGPGVSTDTAVPGWTAHFGTNQFPFVYYNGIGIGGRVIAFHDGMDSQDNFYHPYDGVRHMTLQSGSAPTGDVALAQFGEVPTDSLSLRLVAAGIGFPNEPIISFNGQPVQLYDLGLAPGSTLYHQFAGDISPFAGTSGELRIATLRSAFYLDAIQFSPIAIPEPSTWALLALGSALCCCAARPRRK